VLRPGGRLAISVVVADPDMDVATRIDMARWTGCIAGVLSEDDYWNALTAVRFRASGARRPTGSIRMPSQRSSGHASLPGDSS
jgi:arsenite methyltransferase